MKNIIYISIILLLFGCSSYTPMDESSSRVIDGNERFPYRDMAVFDDEGIYQKVKSREFDAAVIFSGIIRKDNTIKISSVKDSFPDRTRIALAEKFAADARLSASSVGSNVSAGARIYVVFYETGFEPNLAFVYAEQTNASPSSSSIAEWRYMTEWTY